MSQENVDLVRRYYELLNARDRRGCMDLLAPDVEIVQPALPDGGSFRGRAGWLRWLDALDGAWSEATWEPREFIEAGDAVVVAARVVTKGTHTAIEQEVDRFQVIRVRNGRITFTTGYAQRRQALEAVGLSG